MKNKKGLSSIIETILLILLSITAIIVIAAVIIPFVQNSLNEGKECFEAQGKITVDVESQYTCYYGSNVSKTVNVTIKVGDITLKGIKASIGGEGTTKGYEIKAGADGAGKIRMYSGSNTLEVPEKTGARTYSFVDTGLKKIDYVEIYPILESGRVCGDVKDRAELMAC